MFFCDARFKIVLKNIIYFVERKMIFLKHNLEVNMNKGENIEIMKMTIWFNLFIGIYNLHVFNDMNSLFHLVLGSVNIGVWVFFRQRYLDFSFADLFKVTSKN